MGIVITVLTLCLLPFLAYVVLSNHLGRASFRDYPDAVRTAAFRWVGMPNFRGSVYHGRIEQIAERKAIIQRKRAALHTIKDADVRGCAAAWLSYYESRLPGQEKELREKTGLKKHEAWVREQREKRSEVSAIEARMFDERR